LVLATILYGFHDGRAADDQATPLLADAVAMRFGDALRQRRFSFLTEAQIETRETELRAFIVQHAPVFPNDDFATRLLAGIEPCVDRLYGPPPSNPRSRSREAWLYIWDRDLFRTFEWHLWTALVRRPLRLSERFGY
jgi:hypothetical protein